MEDPRPRRHFKYAMNPEAPAPVGCGGSTRSWFMFYKWDVEGPVFVPRLGARGEEQEGDILWFCFVAEVVGCASIQRVVQNALGEGFELWYLPSAGKVPDSAAFRLPQDLDEAEGLMAGLRDRQADG